MKIILMLAVGLLLGTTVYSVPEPEDSLDYNGGRVVKEDITFEYSTDVLKNQDTRIRKGWAKRKGIHVFYIRILNNSDKPMHGSQIVLLANGEKLEIVDNKLAAKKLKNKALPRALYIIPVTAIVIIAYVAISDWINGDDSSDEPDFTIKKGKPKLNRIQEKLNNFKLGEKLILPGESVDGLVAVKSTAPIQSMDILIRKVDYKIKGD